MKILLTKEFYGSMKILLTKEFFLTGGEFFFRKIFKKKILLHVKTRWDLREVKNYKIIKEKLKMRQNRPFYTTSYS